MSRVRARYLSNLPHTNHCPRPRLVYFAESSHILANDHGDLAHHEKASVVQLTALTAVSTDPREPHYWNYLSMITTTTKLKTTRAPGTVAGDGSVVRFRYDRVVSCSEDAPTPVLLLQNAFVADQLHVASAGKFHPRSSLFSLFTQSVQGNFKIVFCRAYNRYLLLG